MGHHLDRICFTGTKIEGGLAVLQLGSGAGTMAFARMSDVVPSIGELVCIIGYVSTIDGDML
jgi:hypothetical protein